MARAGCEALASRPSRLAHSGARTQYKGGGAITGQGHFEFLLSAVDGAVPGGGGVDKFRIKIWEQATGIIVYENQAGLTDTTDPITGIQGGDIVFRAQ